MLDTALTVEVPADLKAFAEERVRAGHAASVDEVVRDALEATRRAAFDEAIDEGLRDVAEGRVFKGTPEEIMKRVLERAGVNLEESMQEMIDRWNLEDGRTPGEIVVGRTKARAELNRAEVVLHKWSRNI